MNVLLFGRPGAGKGIQSRMLAEDFRLARLSTGDLFRAAVAGGRVELDRYVSGARLADDDVVVELLLPYLAALGPHDGFVLEGFPRRPSQVAILDRILGDRTITRVIYLEVSVAVIMNRLTGRTACTACGRTFGPDDRGQAGACPDCGVALTRRLDDDAAKLAQRLDEFEAQTRAVLRIYADRGLLRSVDGEGSVRDVFARVREACAI